MPDDNTSDGITEGGNPTNPDENASVGESETVSLAELNSLVGRNYTSKDVALKSIKETYSYVGKVGQLKKQESANPPMASATNNNTELESTVKALQEQLEETTFFSERPELKDYAMTLREARATSGKSLAEIVSSEAYKSLFEKALAQDAVQKKRSVLESNPRLGQLRNKTQEAKDALKEGNFNGARETAVSAVLDAYDLGS